MTIDDIKKRIQRIEESKGDDEVAHSMEDTLLTDVLEAIANGAGDASGLAREALKVSEIEFSRWCA